MPTISGYLRMLRDVDGVHGSFVVAGSGMLVVNAVQTSRSYASS